MLPRQQREELEQMLIGPDGIIVMGNADHDTLQKKLAELMP